MKGLAANYCLQGGLLLRKAVEQDVPGFKGAVEKQAFVTDKGSQIRGLSQFASVQGVPEGKAERNSARKSTLQNGEHM